MGPDCGWDGSAAKKVWDELEREGLGRRDEQGRLRLCGTITPNRRIKDGYELDMSEDELWKNIVQTILRSTWPSNFNNLQNLIAIM